MVIAPFLQQVLLLDTWGEDQSFFLLLLSLDCLQFEIIQVPKEHFGVDNSAPLQKQAKGPTLSGRRNKGMSTNIWRQIFFGCADSLLHV